MHHSEELGFIDIAEVYAPRERFFHATLWHTTIHYYLKLKKIKLLNKFTMSDQILANCICRQQTLKKVYKIRDPHTDKLISSRKGIEKAFQKYPKLCLKIKSFWKGLLSVLTKILSCNIPMTCTVLYLCNLTEQT